MKVNDAVPGAILIVFAAGVFHETLSFPPMPGQDYGPALFPQVIAVLMALGGLGLIVKGMTARRNEPWAVAAAWMHSPAHIFNMALLIAGLLFYILASRSLGFIPTAFILLVLLMARLRGMVKLGSTLAIAAGTTLVVQQFFGEVLRVPLPWGIVPPFGW